MDTRTYFNAWIERFGIQEELAPLVDTVVTWVDASSPTYASFENRTIVCMDLALCFFYLDDYRYSAVDKAPGARPHLYDQVETLLNTAGTKAFSQQDTRLLRAYSDLFQRIVSFGFSFDRYREGRKDLIRSYRLRNKIRQGEVSLTFKEYLQLRTTTIFMEQWLDLWASIGIGNISLEERNLHAYFQARSEMCTWQVLENELVSVKRDLQTGVPNLVMLLAKEKSVPLNVAWTEIKNQAQQALQNYLKAREELGRLIQGPTLQQAVDLVDLTYKGALKIYRSGQLERYEAPPTLVLQTES